MLYDPDEPPFWEVARGGGPVTEMIDRYRRSAELKEALEWLSDGECADTVELRKLRWMYERELWANRDTTATEAQIKVVTDRLDRRRDILQQQLQQHRPIAAVEENDRVTDIEDMTVVRAYGYLGYGTRRVLPHRPLR